MGFKTETKLGSDCSGSDGSTNRSLTLNNIGVTYNDGLLVNVGYSTLANGVDFNINHLNINSVITFTNPVYDSQNIIVTYQEGTILSPSTSLNSVGAISALLIQSFNDLPDSVSANMTYFVDMARQFVATYTGANIDAESIDSIYQNPIYFIASANLLDIIGAQIGNGSISLSELNLGAPTISTSAQGNRLLGEMALKNIGRKIGFARSLS